MNKVIYCKSSRW